MGVRLCRKVWCVAVILIVFKYAHTYGHRKNNPHHQLPDLILTLQHIRMRVWNHRFRPFGTLNNPSHMITRPYIYQPITHMCIMFTIFRFPLVVRVRGWGCVVLGDVDQKQKKYYRGLDCQKVPLCFNSVCFFLILVNIQNTTHPHPHPHPHAHTHIERHTPT